MARRYRRRLSSQYLKIGPNALKQSKKTVSIPLRRKNSTKVHFDVLHSSFSCLCGHCSNYTHSHIYMYIYKLLRSCKQQLTVVV